MRNDSRNRESLTVRRFAELRQSSQRENTRGVTRALLHNLYIYTDHDIQIQEVTEPFVRKFTNHLLMRIRPGSVRTYIQKFHSIMEEVVREGYLPNNPVPVAVSLIPRYESDPRSFLTVDELNTLSSTNCKNEEVKRAFLFACFTGLRLSDIETLRWDNLHVVGGTQTIVKTQVKTGHEIRIPLNRDALSVLGKRNQGELTDKVFVLPSRTYISQILNRWALVSGIGKHITFHTSRHTFATLAITAGVEIYTVSKLCGHRSVRTTEIYTHIIDTTLREGVDKISKLLSHNDFS
ncbi:MAG: tyrosine-type recombinase/integrase [Paludibacteraceae bacterium]|nr:tyrosine-type recombinase/integrase [Paludibacteraceae bacterium]